MFGFFFEGKVVFKIVLKDYTVYRCFVKTYLHIWQASGRITINYAFKKPIGRQEMEFDRFNTLG